MSRVPSSATSDRAAREKLNQALLRLTKRVAALERGDAADNTEIEALETDVAALQAAATGDKLRTYKFFFASGTGALRYLPIGGGTQAEQSTPAGGAGTTMVARTACTIVQVVLRTTGSSYGSTVVGTHLNGNTTPDDTDTQTLDAGAAAFFTLDTDASAGDNMHISFDPTGSSGSDCTGILVIDEA